MLPIWRLYNASDTGMNTEEWWNDTDREDEGRLVLVPLCAAPISHRVVSCFLHPTPWSTVLPEKLTRPQLIKKFTAFYGSRKFITAFTTARHLSLSWTRSIQSTSPHPTSQRFVLISPSHLWLGLTSVVLPSDFPPKHCMYLSSPPYVLYALPILVLVIWSTEWYLVRSTEHKTPHFSTPLFPRAC
jgi:hypothetical protein